MKNSKQPQALKVKPVPVPSIDHPEPMSSQLMKHEFTLGLIGNHFYKITQRPRVVERLR